jgi:molybdopterin-containing oxidoreductase family iron-sulfur binding subunit
MKKRFGLVIDLERCIGCHTCTIACQLENDMEAGFGVRVETIGGGHRDTPSGRHPDLSMHFLPILCMHCQEPPCMEACPVGAISKREDGIVLVDEGMCDGCQACVASCPYGALSHDEKRNIVRKCNLCVQRVDKGLAPFCVVCCETEAICFGDLMDVESAVSKLKARRGAGVLRPEAGTGPAVFYCPTRKGRIQ